MNELYPEAPALLAQLVEHFHGKGVGGLSTSVANWRNQADLQRFAAFPLGSLIGRLRAILTLVGQRVQYQRSMGFARPWV